jgi:hypothetical protein
MTFDKQSEIKHPLARSERLLVQSVGDEIVVFDDETKTAHALKPLAAAVFTYADGNNTPAEIAELVSYRLAKTVTETEVNEAIAQLDDADLLETPNGALSGAVSRRTALKTFAAAGAGTMLISSVAAPLAMADITGNGDGYSCGQNSSPVTGHGHSYPQPPVSSNWSAQIGNSCGSGSSKGTYQCIPCDGSDGYACCEVACVPSSTTIPGAVKTQAQWTSSPYRDTSGAYSQWPAKYCASCGSHNQPGLGCS